MNPLTPSPMPVEPERLRHVQNEGLLRRDFDSQAALDDQTRWWHNRAIHNTYGIAEGLEAVSVDGALVVRPGLAYDSFGRELMLHAPWQAAIPEADEPLVVVIGRAEHTVAVGWRPLLGFAPRDGVVLATVLPNMPPHDQDRIYTRPLARPRIGHGATVSGGTAWEPWTEVRDGRLWPLGLQVQVDTSAAGFTAVPCYFAQLTGAMWDPRVARLFLLPFQHIDSPDRNQFTYRLLAPWLYSQRATSASGLASAFRGFTSLTGLAVTWTGIQQRRATRRRSTRIGGHGAIH